jgi:hypothetical protein
MDAVDPAAQRAAAAAIPALLRAAHGSAARPDILAFWNAYFRLPHWLLIAQGEEGGISPLVVVAGGRPTVLVFSDAEAAKATGIAAGLSEPEASRLIALPLPGAIDLVASFGQHGVLAVQFDAHVDGGIVIPIGNLPQMRADLLGPSSGTVDAPA